MQFVGIVFHVVVFRVVPAQQGVEIIVQFPASVLREIADFLDSRSSHFIVDGDEQVVKVVSHDIFRLFCIAMVDNPIGLYEPMF